jgi:hypothetical protein
MQNGNGRQFTYAHTSVHMCTPAGLRGILKSHHAQAEDADHDEFVPRLMEAAYYPKRRISGQRSVLTRVVSSSELTLDNDKSTVSLPSGSGAQSVFLPVGFCYHGAVIRGVRIGF